MKATPVKGTNDYLPKQAELRTYMQKVILETYKNHGFTQIMTPAVEDAENLDKSDGGENLNLIFKILKRGDKFTKAIESADFSNLADLGLRYDLTLPLSRYYANNKENLVMPFKCVQIDKVYRAERPQKGRLREFVQCDVDIIGSDSICCECELISTVCSALLKLGISDFKVKVNDRRILRSLLVGIGISPEQLDSVCISLDKLDKMPLEQIMSELTEEGINPDCVARLSSIFSELPITLEKLENLSDIAIDRAALENVQKIIASAQKSAKGKYDVCFDISLVRGQGYYTGTVFEIESLAFKGAVAGGGRYDNLIGKFLNQNIPAVGFSIGFERIFSILSESNFVIPNEKKKIVVIFNEEDFDSASEKAEQLRAEYDVAMFIRPKKTAKFLNKLEEEGYCGFLMFGQSDEISYFSENSAADNN